jgi:hypothetical protein
MPNIVIALAVFTCLSNASVISTIPHAYIDVWVSAELQSKRALSGPPGSTAMPVRWDPWSEEYPSSRHAIICQTAPSLFHDGAKIRYVIIFITGDFTLDEANNFAIALIDSRIVPDKDMFFENPTDVRSTGFSAVKVPEPLGYIVDNFSTMDFTDVYTFHLLHHSYAFYFHELTKIENLFDKRKKEKHLELRLGAGDWVM